MAQCSRWIAVCVDVFEHGVLDHGAYDRRSAWLSLIAMARREDGTINHKGKPMQLQRGQALVGRKFLAKKWGWGEQKVRTFLSLLQDEHMVEIDQSNGHYANVLTICNYDRFQHVDETHPEPDNQRSTSGQPVPNQTPTKTLDTPESRTTVESSLSETSSDMHVQRVTEPEPETPPKPKARKPRTPKVAGSYSDDFTAFWIAYPDRTNNSKPKAYSNWAKLSVEQREQAMAGLAKLAAYCRANPDYRCVHAERYLSGRRWEALLEGNTKGTSVAEAEKAKQAWWRDPTKLASMTPERWRKGVTEHANGIWPIHVLGPPPSDTRCVVPREIIIELGLQDAYTTSGIRVDGKH